MSAILHVQYILLGVEVSNKYCIFIFILQNYLHEILNI